MSSSAGGEPHARLTRDEIAAQFEALNPWVTRFVIGGEAFGGWYDTSEDGRIAQFRGAFPEAANILELGSLEGGHTVRLAQLAGVERVVGIEGRESNVERAQVALRALEVTNAEVRRADLESLSLTSLGRFDVVFNCGLLYHLARPWELLEQISAITTQMFLSTHYCTRRQVNTKQHGYRGYWYPEYGITDPLSGLGARSFWPTRRALFAMLADFGFTDTEVTSEDRRHQHGPIICLAARQPKQTRLVKPNGA